MVVDASAWSWTRRDMIHHFIALEHSCGEAINLLKQSQHGPFITRASTDNVAMRVIRRSNVDWVCSKTQTLLETLKVQNQHQGNLMHLLEVGHFFP